MERSQPAADDRGANIVPRTQSQKRIRFSVENTMYSVESSSISSMASSPAVDRTGPSTIFAEQTTPEMLAPERGRDLEERLLNLWYRGMSKPPGLQVKNFESKKPPFDDDAASVTTELQDYDSSMHNPIFYGKMYKTIDVDQNVMREYDPSQSHPACVGYAFMDKPPKSPPPPPAPLPPKDKCLPRVYLENYIFPTLLPALEEMLRAAKKERCFERKRTKFNALDFLTEYLYNNNTNKPDRGQHTLGEIPFVAEHWKEHPRPPLPKSLLWSEEEATLIVQSHWRGYKVRIESDVQELRQWQREWREENENIHNKVDDFWAKKMPEGEAAEQTTGEVAPPIGSRQNSAEVAPPGGDNTETAVKSPAPETTDNNETTAITAS